MRKHEPGISSFPMCNCTSEVWSFGPSRNDGSCLLRLLRPAQQEHALLAEHVPEPPGRVEPQRTAIEIERDRALHLDVDLVAQLHEILDGAKMDVRRVVPGGRQILRARHVTADQKLQAHPPEAEIR